MGENNEIPLMMTATAASARTASGANTTTVWAVVWVVVVAKKIYSRNVKKDLKNPPKLIVKAK